jgi:nucleotide-binding universal stress UspA family protein
MSPTVLSSGPSLAADTVQRQLGPIVVATDGSAGAVGALRAASELAAVSATNVIVVGVLEPMPIVVADYGITMPPVESVTVRRRVLHDAIKAQLDEILGTGHGWTIELQEGHPATLISRVARDYNARVLILGLGHHDLVDRLMGGEIALQVLRMARVPVLAVPRDFRHIPKRIAVACDFSEGSQQAARAALDVFPALTMVYLVHVEPRLDIQPEALLAGIGSAEDLDAAFAKFVTAMEIPSGIAIETMTLHGKPSRAILDFAKSAHLDAVVTGSRGGGFIDRIMVGSTATGIIRGAECAVLGVPTLYRRRIVTQVIPEKVHGEPVEAERWAGDLEVFTQRNAGRMVSLEVDDPELGAQFQVNGYPFLGASYDHNDRRVELMLGELGESERHLSRGITDVRAVEVLRDAEGRDVALRVAHGDGQTLLLIDR